MRRAARTLGAIVAAVFLAGQGRAWAHGGLPTVHQAFVRPGVPDELWIESTFGLLVSTDGGGRWHWICEESPGYSSHAALHVMPSGRVLAATLYGLLVSDDQGCSWTAHPVFATADLSDVQADPSAPETLYVTTNNYDAPNTLFRSTDSGANFVATGLSNVPLYLSAVRIAPADPQRVYVSAWQLHSPDAMVLYRSDDGAQTFSPIDHTAALGGSGVFSVWAVHPEDPDELYASVHSTAGSQHSFLYRSTDGGQSFTQLIESVGAFSAVTFSEDATQVWAASDSGVWRSDDGGQSFTKLEAGPKKNACVLQVGGTTWACGSQLVDGYAFAKSTNGGDTFTPVLRLREIAGPPACPEGSNTKDVCEAIWPVQVSEFPVETVDAGTGDAGQGPRAEEPQGCACGGAGGGSVWGGAGAVLGFFTRRRRRRTSAVRSET